MLGNSLFKLGFFATVLAVVSGCQYTSESAASVTLAGVDVTASDNSTLKEKVLTSLGNDTRTPEGFYKPQYDIEIMTTTYHLKSTDVNPNAGARYDLCSDDVNEAFSWLLGYYAANSDATLLDTGETAQYFKADWLFDTTPASIREVRVFKCGYIDRTAYDWRQGGDVLAKVNGGAISGELLKNVTDYLWYFSPNNNYGNAILDGSVIDDSGNLRYEVTEAYNEFNWSGGCDSALIVKATYQIDPTTRLLTVSRVVVDSVAWTRAPEGPILCAG